MVWASRWFELMVLITPQFASSDDKDDKDGTDNHGLHVIGCLSLRLSVGGFVGVGADEGELGVRV